MLLGVRCDGEYPSSEDWDCPSSFEADFLVGTDDDRDTRLGYVLDHVSTNEGWVVVGRATPDSALAFCPACVEQAREL